MESRCEGCPFQQTSVELARLASAEIADLRRGYPEPNPETESYINSVEIESMRIIDHANRISERCSGAITRKRFLILGRETVRCSSLEGRTVQQSLVKKLGRLDWLIKPSNDSAAEDFFA